MCSKHINEKITKKNNGEVKSYLFNLRQDTKKSQIYFLTL